MSFPIPEIALAQHIAVLGKTGSGKTSTAKLIIEHVVDDGARVCILDPIKSDWWGLTSSADGHKAGLPFGILGGPHGHAPLHATSGKIIGDLVATGALPLSIADMALFNPGGHSQFFIDFAQTLLRRIKGVVYLVMEEAHIFAPKERSGIGAETMAIHWAKMLATAGRSKGIRLVLVTQRTQSLHNALLGSCDTMIAHRLTAPADQEPVKSWLKANVERPIMEEVASGLSSLPTGSAWLCSGEAKLFELIAFPRIKTYDNTATPTGAISDRQVTTAKVDLDRLRSIIGDAVSEAQENDPKALKAEVAKLRAELAKRHPQIDSDHRHQVEQAFERGKKDGLIEGRMATVAALGQFARSLSDSIKTAQEKIDGASRLMDSYASFVEGLAADVQNRHPVRPAPVAQRIERRTPNPEAARSSRAGSANGHAELSGPQRQMLGAIAWWAANGHDRPTRVQVAAVAGWRITSGHIKNVAGSLRTLGLIDYPTEGTIALTDAGAKLAPEPDLSQDLVSRLRGILTGPQLSAFETLLKSGKPLSRQALCERVGWNETSGHVKNVLGSMRSLQIINYPGTGMVELADWVG